MEIVDIPREPVIAPRDTYPVRSRVLWGVLKGTGIAHLALLPKLGISNLFEPETPILEKIVMGSTAIAEGIVYYALARRGIPAYWLPIATNAVGAIGSAAALFLMDAGPHGDPRGPPYGINEGGIAEMSMTPKNNYRI